MIKDVEDVHRVISLCYFMQDCIVSLSLHVRLIRVTYGFLMRSSTIRCVPCSAGCTQLAL